MVERASLTHARRSQVGTGLSVVLALCLLNSIVIMQRYQLHGRWVRTEKIWCPM